MKNEDLRDMNVELLKCKYDAVYFYENYFLVNGEKPSPLRSYEKDLLRKYTNTEVCGCGCIVCEELGNCRNNAEKPQRINSKPIIKSALDIAEEFRLLQENSVIDNLPPNKMTLVKGQMDRKWDRIKNSGEEPYFGLKEDDA